jgi:uncharacterized protein with HEPN domain
MQRDLLFLGEMIDAAEQIQHLAGRLSVIDLESDRQRRDALLWNFTILGEAASRLDRDVTARFPQIEWSRPIGLRNRIVHGYWSADLDILLTTARKICQASPRNCALPLTAWSPRALSTEVVTNSTPPPRTATPPPRVETTPPHRRPRFGEAPRTDVDTTGDDRADPPLPA